VTMILVMSPKGGTGVTAIAAELARGLAQSGRDVVAVNLTDQAALGHRLSGTVAMGEGSDDRSMTSAGASYQEVEGSTPSGKARADFAIAQLRENATVIVDVSAGDRETRNALIELAELVICVIGADAGSLAVLPQAMQFQGVTPYYILNLVDERRDFSADAVTLMVAAFGDKLLGIIRQDEAVNEALALLAEIAPTSGAANDLALFTRRIDGLITARNVLPVVRDVA
jgi:chromosome partitioning protein